MRTAARELVQGLRLWLRQPLFLLTSVAVLAIGLGANLTVFTIANGLLLRQISPDHPEQLVSLYSRDAAQPDSYRSFSYSEFENLRGAKEIFADVAMHFPMMVGVAERDQTRRTFGEVVSANFFATLETPLAKGRAFTDAETAPAADVAVAVITDSLYNRLGRPDDILTRTLRINGREFAIVGLTPPTFTGTTAIAAAEVWLPLGVYESVQNDFAHDGKPLALADETNHGMFLVGRLAPGVTIATANRLLTDVGHRIAAADPALGAHQQLFAEPLSRLGIGTRPPRDTPLRIGVALLFAAATVVLVIACLNVATLLLSRGMARRREIAIRLALGATRWRIVRQLLGDALAVAATASLIGMWLAYRASSLLFATIQSIAPVALVFDPRPDTRTLTAAVGWTFASTLMFALGPALKLTRFELADDLQRRPRFGSGSGWRRRLSGTNALVIGQIALSLTLLTTAALFLRGASHVVDAPLGFALDGQVVAAIDPALGGFDQERTRQLNLAALERVRALPARSVSFASTIPFGDVREGKRLSAFATTRRDETVAAGFRVIGRDYFRTLGVPLIGGRDFSVGEERGAVPAPVAVVDQLAANKLWPGQDAIGRTVYMLAGSGQPQAVTIVGVVASSRSDLLSDPEPALYVPFGQQPRSTMTLHVRVGPDRAHETAALGPLRAALMSVNPKLPVRQLAALRTVRDESGSMWIVNASGRIFGILGLLAALLAVTGLYAVIAYIVTRRVKEIGIRVALGAEARDVLLLVVRDGAVLTGAGLAIGVLLSAAAVQVVRAAAERIAFADATVFLVPPLLLASAALLASAVPARRAARLQPLVALREE